MRRKCAFTIDRTLSKFSYKTATTFYTLDGKRPGICAGALFCAFFNGNTMQ